MILLLVSLAVCLVIGIPIAFSLGFSGMLYFAINDPSLLGIIPKRVFSGYNSYSMIALPLFILMGQLMNDSGITKRIIDFSNLIFGRLKGGMGCINVFASMIFGGISGSSASDTAETRKWLPDTSSQIPPCSIRSMAAKYSARFRCSDVLA